MDTPIAATTPLPRLPGPRCPLCNRKLVRTRRSLSDHLISLVTPVRRYYCIDFCCHWQGRVRVRDIDAAAPLRAVPKRGTDALA